MSRRRLYVVLTIVAVLAAFFAVVPLAERFAEQQLGWNQAGQTAFAKIAFFPILLLFLCVLKWLGARRRVQPPRTD